MRGKSDGLTPAKHEIWLLLDSLSFGGIETHVVELARGLATHGVKVRVVLLSQFNQPSAIIERLNAAGLAYSFLCELANAPNTQSFVKLVSQLHLAITRFSPGVLHSHGYKASLVSKLARGRTRQLSTFHAGETPKGRARLYDSLDRYTAFLSSRVISVSQGVADKLPSPSVVLNNFITTETIPASSGKQIAFVGRLSHEKGPDILLQIAKQTPDLSFEIYGDGPMREQLEQHASPNCHFHGFQADMSAVWKQVGLLLITSRFEGLPMTAIEAMARGIPVISTQVGAIDRLIEHEQNGWIVQDSEQFPTLIANWLATSPARQQSLKDKARETVKAQFSAQAVIPQVMALYSLDASSQPIHR
ncbi:glycosyltransferase family 4 protein [Vibrio sp. WXL103]|uniref:glycosyltransferase family 4 protein n=1 Tax=Vibrio sp. WXL103 TaxID=3450710 RepID=UPI003EC686BA